MDRARSALSNHLSATSWLSHHEPGEVQNHQHSGIRRASARRAKRRWSDSSLQVEDPKASGTPTSLANTCATFPGSATTMAAHSIMVCALCQRRSLASAQACSSDLPSSCAYSERYRNDGRPLWMVFAALNRSEYVSAASDRAASCSCRVRPRVLWEHFGHSGAIPAASAGEIQQPAACTRRPQRWGRGSGRLERYTDA